MACARRSERWEQQLREVNDALALRRLLVHTPTGRCTRRGAGPHHTGAPHAPPAIARA